MRKRNLWLCFAMLFCFSLLASGCDIAASNSRSIIEVRRVTSPNQKLDLVSYEAAGGATVGYTNALYLLKRGEKKPEVGYLILTAKGKDAVQVKWTNNAEAVLLVGGRKIEHFTNYAYAEKSNGNLEDVRFHLK